MTRHTLLLSLVLLAYLMSGPAWALEKITFNNLGHSGKPDLKALYGITLLPSIGYNTYAGWDAPALGLPTQTWCDNVAANQNPVDHWLVIDLEQWPVSTQAERLAASDKFVYVYQCLKALRPDLKIAFYQYPNFGDFFNAIDDPSSGTYQTWQQKNTDFATMAGVVDAYMPTLYLPDGADPGVPTGGIDYFYLYAHAHIQEMKRLRTTYGRADQGIYPYVYWRTAGDVAMAQWVFQEMTRVAYTEADGLVLFGGSGHTWTEAIFGGGEAWWVNFLAQWPFGNRQIVKPRTAVVRP